MDPFVCVRLVQANRMDLTRLQFDFDLTFAVILMHPDGTVYGRYGNRDSRDAEEGISLEGFAKALQRALDLHAAYPENKEQLAGKQPQPTDVSSPEEYAMLGDKYQEKIDYAGNVMSNCLHCHQIHEAQRQAYVSSGEPIPEKLFFPYPSPQTIGIELDQQDPVRVTRVDSGSLAFESGLRDGDRIVSLDGQSILSIADVRWVLEHAQTADTLPIVVDRNEQRLTFSIELPSEWRRQTDISWRASTWLYRRLVSGGMRLETVPPNEREELGIPPNQMALRANYLSRFGPYGAARRAGFKTGDIIIEYGGRSDLSSDSQLLVYGVESTRPGQQIPVRVLRAGKRLDLTLPRQR